MLSAVYHADERHHHASATQPINMSCVLGAVCYADKRHHHASAQLLHTAGAGHRHEEAL